MSRGFASALPALLVAGLAGCGGPPTSGPPEFHFGRDLCAECGMTISEPRFAAAYRLPDGSVRKFDDLGDLLAYGRRAGERPSGAVWVHDYATDGWVAAAEAWFVRVPGLTSPMGHGIAAFAGEGAAADFARARGGRVRRWPDLQDSSGAPTTGQ